MILYFSGTGNSRYTAEYIAELTGDEAVDIGARMREAKEGGAFTSRAPFVFVCPVYGWRIPRVFEQFLRKSSFHGTREAYFVITCGSDIGNAAGHLRGFCREKGMDLKGVSPVIMPENYIAMFEAPGKEEAEKIVDAAIPVIEGIAEKIKRGESIPEAKIHLTDRLKSGIVNTCFYAFCVKAKGFQAEESCIGCGKCERICPLNNIRLQRSRPVWGNRCTHCMACICGCPKEAIEYKNISRGKKRYYNDRKVPKGKAK